MPRQALEHADSARPLDILAGEIKAEHEEALAAARNAIGHAIRCGELLVEAKQQVTHGRWGAWLGEHFPASQRTAQGYMRLARAAKTQALAHMGIEGALRELSAPRPGEGQSQPSEPAHDHEWVHEEIEAVIRLVREVDSRDDILRMLDFYSQAHRIVTSETRLTEIRAVCAVIGDVAPLIQTMPADRSEIPHVWFGYIDERDDVLVHHPGWLDYCLKVGGDDARVARVIDTFLNEMRKEDDDA